MNMGAKRNLTYDALILGGGNFKLGFWGHTGTFSRFDGSRQPGVQGYYAIAGLEAALNLADQDFSVALVEKDASIGGKMIRLSKVFPTLDCSSCITTPKMAAAAHHPNITIFTYCEMQSLTRQDGELVAAIRQKARFVDEVKCIGCRQCEYQCPILEPDD